MAWLKLHEGASSNLKWPVIAKKAKTNGAVVVGIWIAMLDHASQRADRGSLEGFDCETLDAFYRLKDGTCERVLSAMEEKGLIADGRIANWEKYQPETIQSPRSAPSDITVSHTPKANCPQDKKAPKSNAERQQEYRQRKAERNAGVTANVTPRNESVTKRNALTIENHSTSNESVTENVTQRNENVTPCNAGVTDVTECNENVTQVTKSNENVTQRNAASKNNIKIKIKNKIKRNTESIKACAELASSSTPEPPQTEEALLLPVPVKKPDPVVMELPVTGDPVNPMHKVFSSEVEKWQELYPAVDVMQQIRHMRGWLDAKPKRRKTKRGIAAFIARWLAREQDRTSSVARASPAQRPGQTRADTEYQKQQQEQREMSRWLLGLDEMGECHERELFDAADAAIPGQGESGISVQTLP